MNVYNNLKIKYNIHIFTNTLIIFILLILVVLYKKYKNTDQVICVKMSYISNTNSIQIVIF